MSLSYLNLLICLIFNLKRLAFDTRESRSTLIGSDNEWLLQNYPKLEHFEVNARNGQRIDELKNFFELNPNVQSFSTTADFLWKNRHSILDISTNFTFQELAIKLDRASSMDSPKEFTNFLNDLHNRQFFKRLKVYYPNGFGKEVIEGVDPLNVLVKLYFETFGNSDLMGINELALENLEELCICPQGPVDVTINRLLTTVI